MKQARVPAFLRACFSLLADSNQTIAIQWIPIDIETSTQYKIRANRLKYEYICKDQFPWLCLHCNCIVQVSRIVSDICHNYLILYCHSASFLLLLFFNGKTLACFLKWQDIFWIVEKRRGRVNILECDTFHTSLLWKRHLFVTNYPKYLDSLKRFATT